MGLGVEGIFSFSSKFLKEIYPQKYLRGQKGYAHLVRTTRSATNRQKLRQNAILQHILFTLAMTRTRYLLFTRRRRRPCFPLAQSSVRPLCAASHVVRLKNRKYYGSARLRRQLSTTVHRTPSSRANSPINCDNNWELTQLYEL